MHHDALVCLIFIVSFPSSIRQTPRLTLLPSKTTPLMCSHSQQSLQASKNPLIIPILPIPSLMLALDFATVVHLYPFWCIAWFCNLLLLPTCLSHMLTIGWLVIHQWPLMSSLLTPLYDRWLDQFDRRPEPDTSHHTPLVVRHCRVTIECQGWYLVYHF